MSEINTALLNDFIDESREHLDEMESLLLQLGTDLENLELLNDIFRTMHNVKGASQLTGLQKISRLSHRLEDLLDLLRRGEKQTTSVIVNLLIAGRDRIVKLVSELESDQLEITDVDDLIERLNIIIDGGVVDVPVKESADETDVQGEQDIYEGEDDRELIDIFNDHMKEQFSILASSNDDFRKMPVASEQLEECLNAVVRLRSSANYMGYEELVKFFSNWRDSIEEAILDYENGDDVFIDFMGRYIEELENRYPELKDFKAGVYADRGEDSSLQSDQVSESPTDTTGTSITVQEPDIESYQTVINTGLLDEFIEEAREHLDEMESLLLQLGTELENLDLLDNIFRTMHNVKGASQLTGLDKISRLSHRLEDLLDLLRQKQMSNTPDIVNTLIEGRDLIVKLVSELESSQLEVSPVNDMISRLNQLIDNGGLGGDINISIDRVEQSVAADTDTDTGIGEVISINADFREEGDQELFDIFQEHMKEQFSTLNAAAAHFREVPIDEDHLEECKEAVLRLRSSSNYMGYEELVRFFDKWAETIEFAISNVAASNEVNPVFMDGYISELIEKFPSLKDATVSIVERNQSASSPRSSQKNALDDESSISAQQHSPSSDQNEQIPEQTLQVRGTVSQIEDNQLFNRLNSALETSLQKVSESEYETLNNVFDELVTNADKQGQSVVKRQTAEEVTDKKAGMLSRRRQKLEQVQNREKENKDKKVKKTLRVDADKIDALMNQVGELVVDRSYFYQLFNEMRDLQQYLKEVTGVDQKELKMFRAFSYRLSEAISSLGRTSNELQEGVMKMRMLPISHLFNRYPRLVHDLTMNTDKKVNLVLRGEETELDKMIVEELSDPLIHIIRNAIDHGLESSDDRLKSGKAESGKLILEAYQESNHIVIEVTDDGRGLNPVRIKEKAVSKGIYTVDEIDRLSARDVMNIILMPGFSTAEKITGTSGRGVGMDVVKKNIEKLNGTLDIDSRPGKGTRMRLKIPLTLAIIHALMVRVGQDMFTIPLANVDETVRISKEDTSIVEGVEVIHLRGIALPIFRLSTLFKVSADQNLDKSFVVIVNTDGQRIGFVVDELLGQEEVVIKPLEDYVQEKSGFSGATIVGDGRISLILDVYELVKMTTSRQVKMHKKQAELLKQTRPKLIGKSGEMGDRLH